MTRAIRQYGRRAPSQRRAISFSRIFTGKVPAHPAAADYLTGLNGGWEMLGNDVAGDCVAVTWANMRRLVTAICGAENYPGQDAVWQIYRTQNPGFDPNGTAETNGPGSTHDQGMDIQTLLEYLVKVGGPDGVKALGFAKVDPTNTEEVKAAIAIFGTLWTGIVVQEANQDDFAAGRHGTTTAAPPTKAATPSLPAATGRPVRARSAVTSEWRRGPRRPRSRTPTGAARSRRPGSSSGPNTSSTRTSWRASTWPRSRRRTRRSPTGRSPSSSRCPGADPSSGAHSFSGFSPG
ncbi:hypothetical protein ACFQ51_56695 [Streptomyces kaempferi]